LRRPAGVLAAVAAVLAVVLGSIAWSGALGKSESESRTTREQGWRPTASQSRSAPMRLPNGVTLAVRTRVLGPVAVGETELAWESGAYEGEGPPASLFTRGQNRRSTKIAHDVDPAYGLAAAAGWTVFGRSSDTGEQLLARRGGRTLVLSRALAAPIA
jgi:hypothetical protein